MATRPTVTAYTDRLYGRLPELYTYADELGRWDLLRYLSLVGDRAGAIADLITRLDYVPPSEGGTAGDTSDLVNPDTADPAWLPWLAQLVGVTVPPTADTATRRALIRGASSGYQAGTPAGMLAAARTALTGTKYATIVTQTTDVSGYGAAGAFEEVILTRDSETPSRAAVLAAIAAANAKPAGFTVYVRGYAPTLATLAARRPLLGDYYVAGVPITLGAAAETMP